MQSTVKEGFELRGDVTPVRELFRELWRSRRLIKMLARRDFHVRYRRPSFGLLWVVLVPLIQATVLSIIFSRIVRFETGTSFPVFMLTGLLGWNYFSSVVPSSPNAITGGSGLAAKVYFPRAILPLILVRSNLYGFGLRVLVTLAATFVFRVGLKPSIILLGPAIVLMVLLSAAFALVLAALQVYFRDVSFIVSAVTQAWFWGSAVIHPFDLAHGPLKVAMTINPGTGMVYFFRMAIIGSPTEGWLLISAVAWSVGLLIFATFLYRRYDRVFIDLL